MPEIYKKFTPDLYHVIHKVDIEHDNMRLDLYIQMHLASFSRERIKKKIKSGDIQIKGRPSPHRASTRVRTGDEVSLKTTRGNMEDEYWNNQLIKVERAATIIHENEHVIVISKPPYMATHPTGRHLFNCATVYLENIRPGAKIRSVHRLDRETSGVLILGKTTKAAQVLTEMFENEHVHKAYFLIAHKLNKVEFPFTANERMAQDDNFIPRIFVHHYPPESSQGKRAQTDFHLLYENETYLLALALPKTGRQHQIRVHAACHGLPLVGDKLYNGDPSTFMRFKDHIATVEDHKRMQLPRHALHAMDLILEDKGLPFKERFFQAPIPTDLKEWIFQNLPNVRINEIELKVRTLIKNIFQVS